MIKELRKLCLKNCKKLWEWCFTKWRIPIIRIFFLKKEPNGNSGVEMYNKWNEKFIRGAHQQFWGERRKNWFLVWGTDRRKMKNN